MQNQQNPNRFQLVIKNRRGTDYAEAFLSFVVRIDDKLHTSDVFRSAGSNLFCTIKQSLNVSVKVFLKVTFT